MEGTSCGGFKQGTSRSIVASSDRSSMVLPGQCTGLVAQQCQHDSIVLQDVFESVHKACQSMIQRSQAPWQFSIGVTVGVAIGTSVGVAVGVAIGLI